MRAGIVAAALVAGAIAVPLNEKRGVVYETEVNVVTNHAYVTVTQGADAAEPTPEQKQPAAYQAQDAPVEVNVVTNYAYETVTEGAAAAQPTQEKKPSKGHWGHGGNGHRGHPNPYVNTQPAPAPSPEPETEQPAPAPYTSPEPEPEPETTQEPEPTTQKAPEPEPTQSQPDSGNGGGLAESYKDRVLLHHNLHRRNHSNADLEWDDELADIAKEIGSSCRYGHVMDKRGINYGQNIASGTSADEVTKVITDQFYNGEFDMFKNPDGSSCWGQDECYCEPDGYFEDFGHITQLLWADSTHVGCHTFDCSAYGSMTADPETVGDIDMSNVPPYFTVCNYVARGNMNGQFKQCGVGQGHPTIQWDHGIVTK